MVGSQNGIITICDDKINSICALSLEKNSDIVYENKYARSIRSLAFNKQENKLLFSTYGAQIFTAEFDGKEIKNPTCHMTGHYTPCQ